MRARAPAGGGAGPSQSWTRSRRGTSSLAQIQHKRGREELGVSVDASAEKTSIQGTTKGGLEGDTGSRESGCWSVSWVWAGILHKEISHYKHDPKEREAWMDDHRRVLEHFRGQRVRARPEGTTLEEGVGTPQTPGRAEAGGQLHTGRGDGGGCGRPPLAVLRSRGGGSQALCCEWGWRKRNHHWEE